MIPLKDTEPNRYTQFPIMVFSLILLNGFVFAYQMSLLFESQTALRLFIDTYKLIPYDIVHQQGGGIITAITSMFLHADIFHIAGNMLVLWIFGRRVEDACGPWRFLIFYLICGLSAEIIYIAIRAESQRGALGASGAISGVMGAYLMLYPAAKIRVLILWFVPIWPRLHAIWVVLYMSLFTQVLPAIDVLFGHPTGNVGYWAHLGGFFGSLAVIFFLRPTASTRFWKSLPI